MKPYGYELIMDLHGCDPTRMTRDGVREYCAQVCGVIDMKREEFHIWASDEKDYQKDPAELYGVSAVQFIRTSSLVIHTLPKMLRAYVNLFSCKWFDPMEASRFTTEYFSGTLANSKFLERI